MLNFLHHLFLPRESNNHRARLLHLKPLAFLVTLLLLMSFLTPHVEHTYPGVLGISANISINDLVNLTNQQRAANGLGPLRLDSQLSQAAANKATDMFAKNYWAHNAPDGTTPWIFIKGAGYEYLYAGENLARGFTTASDAMNAWMASPGHRENILSPNYKDVGFAVQTGTLTGDDTVLIVEEFGERLNSTPAVTTENTQPTVAPPVAVAVITPVPTIVAVAQIIPSATPLPTSVPVPTEVLPESLKPVQPVYIASLQKQPLINKDFLMKNLALVVVSLLLFLFILDMIIIERKKIVRLVAHSADHILFLSIVLLTILLYSRGIIL